MLSKARCFSLRQSLCPLIYLWRREADEGPEIKISTWETSRFEISLLTGISCTPRETANIRKRSHVCKKQNSFQCIFMYVCVCVCVYLLFNECVSDWDLLGVGSFQAASTRTCSSPASCLQSFVLLHLTDSSSSAEKQVLFQSLILTLSELLVLYSPHCSSILAKALPRKGSEDQLTLGY